jgi:hypothetical protein
VGTVWVVVTAGGWRTDSALVRITPPAFHVVLRERWDSSWLSRWRGFGVPASRLIISPRGPALITNGDGSYASGVYLRAPVAAGDGVGLEAWASMPITHTQWQTLTLELRRADYLERLKTWDHLTGPGPVRNGAICSFTVPSDEGAIGRDSMHLRGESVGRHLRTPPSLISGTWHRLRLQVMADGRCALAVDGVPMGITTSSSTVLPREAMVMIFGDTRFDARILVGSLEIWTGVRGGVDWTKFESDAAKPPP